MEEEEKEKKTRHTLWNKRHSFSTPSRFHLSLIKAHTSAGCCHLNLISLFIIDLRNGPFICEGIFPRSGSR